MLTWVTIAASILAGVWLVETVLFLLSYRTSRRVENSSGDAQAPLWRNPWCDGEGGTLAERACRLILTVDGQRGRRCSW